MKKHLMKCIGRAVILALSVVVLLGLFPTAAYAAEEPTFLFELTVDGKELKKVETGDIITVTLRLKRTDADERYTMYAMQNEILYDSSFFELVPGGEVLSPGIRSSDVAGSERPFREFYMNFLSFGGGEQWKTNTMIGSFQLKVLATNGASKIKNTDFLVSFKDGSGKYEAVGNELVVALYSGCIVTFETGVDGLVPDATVDYGALLTKPEDPVLEGMIFDGWYKDAAFTTPWNFEGDIVEDTMTVYAKWSEIPPAVQNSVFGEIPTMVWPIAGGGVALLVVLIVLLSKKKKTEIE